MNKLKILIPNPKVNKECISKLIDEYLITHQVFTFQEQHFSHIKEHIDFARRLSILKNDYLINIALFTSSDFIIRELSNLILLNNINENDFNKIKDDKYLKGISYNMRLHYNQVEAYLIKKNGKLKKLKVNNQGIWAETFDEVIDNQNELSGKLYEMYLENKG